MKPTDLQRAIKLAIDTKKSLFIWSPPGMGKSNIVHAVTDAMKLPLIDLRLALMDSVELRGLPTIVQNGHATITRWAIPEFLPQDPKSKGVIFCDELTAASPSVQVLAYQLADVRFRGIGESYKLPDGWAVIAASNRQGDRAVSNRMPSALAGRFIHVDLDVDLEDWVTWALGNGITPEIIAFLRNLGKHLYDFDPATWKDGKPFASPRSWENLNSILMACPEVFNLGKSKGNKEDLKSWQLELVKGTVGDAAGTQFFLWLRTYTEIPSIDEILLNASGASVPTKPGGQYAIAGGLAHRAKKDNVSSVFTYLARLPKEFAVYSVRDIGHMGQAGNANAQSCITTKEFQKWAHEMTKEGLL